MLLIAVVACSLVLQIITILYALRLISLTGGKIAWILLSISITTMGIRRLFSLIPLLTGSSGQRTSLSFELVGLAGSGIMLAGVLLIAPLFKAIKKAEQTQRQLVADLQRASSEIKVLKGFLPVCSVCKRIRDDKGNWDQMEAYITRHSEASFTHGLCPDCQGRYYPDFSSQ